MRSIQPPFYQPSQEWPKPDKCQASSRGMAHIPQRRAGLRTVEFIASPKTRAERGCHLGDCQLGGLRREVEAGRPLGSAGCPRIRRATMPSTQGCKPELREPATLCTPPEERPRRLGSVSRDRGRFNIAYGGSPAKRDGVRRPDWRFSPVRARRGRRPGPLRSPPACACAHAPSRCRSGTIGAACRRHGRRGRGARLRR